MRKYIDADKLISEIKGIIAAVQAKNHPDALGAMEQCLAAAEIEALNLVLDDIKGLQQEQPMPDSTKLIEFWNEDKEMLKEKDFRDDAWRLAHNAFMCGFGRGIAVNKQEQPEVDLEKEIDRLFEIVRGEDGMAHVSSLNGSICDDWKKSPYAINKPGFIHFARHFYELGFNTRKEE